MPGSMQAGDVLADRYRLDDLLAETGSGRFWRAHDQILHRPVAIHVLDATDERAGPLLAAARAAGPVADRRLLRVLDAEVKGDFCYVVNEWGQGDSLDILLVREGPLAPRRAAWLIAEVADSIAVAHAAGLAHGRLAPENVLIDQHGQVRIIGFGVDAALSGLPPHRITVDEIDLVGLLYCALTGRWAGISSSALPAAPEDHGVVLRPRRVRAGIPRVLDTLCDQALNPDGGGTETSGLSAHDLADHLHGYVGDLTGTQAPAQPIRPVSTPTASATPAGPPTQTQTETPVPIAVPLPEPEAAAAPQPDPGPAVEPQVGPTETFTSTSVRPVVPPVPMDLPTQAGMPVFHDDDEVDWLRARTEPVTPPPPLDDVPPKPLFAPDPPEGEPVRRPRPGARTGNGGADYWPWESADSLQDSGADSRTDSRALPPVGRDTGSWASSSWSGDRWGGDDGADDTGDQVPGRSWIRLAMIVAVCLLVMVAAVAAYQLGLKPPAADDDTPAQETSETPSVTRPKPFTDLTAVDFDPQGAEPREENSATVPNVLDGDPATAWTTSTYQQNFGPAGLKTGVGLIVDLGAAKGVRQLAVTTVGGATSLAAYVTTTAPAGISGLTPVGTASGTGELSISVDEAVSGRFVTVWLTLLPAVDDGFRGAVAEVQVLG